MIALWIVLAALALFVLVLTVRTMLFRPRPIPTVDATPAEFDRDAATEALRALVTCRTVSRYDSADEEDEEFEKLVALLPTLYPRAYEALTLRRFDGRALLFHWKGQKAGAATVLMAHYDVVPVDESGWEKPPFDGVIEDGVLWGRGTLDTKATMNGILFAVNHLIGEGFVPEHDVYLAFSGGEEVNGAGARNIVEHFRTEGIEVALVLDEGGAVVERVFPGVSTPAAVVGIAEKGMLDLEYRVRSSGGHASAPKPHTPVTRLAAACTAVLRHPPRMRLSAPTREMFDTLGRHSSLLYRVIFANLWCFGPLLGWLGKSQGGELGAMIRTTVAFTRMRGSDANNVLPTEATMVSNIRLAPGDTVDGMIAHLRRAIDDKEVELCPIQGTDPSRVSRTDCEGYARLADAIRATWTGAIVTPYLMMQCSDSRHWGAVSDRVYRFSAMDLTSEERRTIHGHNEGIRLESIARGVEFYLRLLKKS